MRIQHNIMAMNAYRNYTNNVSAMKSNLEKLSSGYKINRAGDDAAGLAISEKMRAQITGLETAQKNAKDGISLVQTAEGALTEVHDMLNRMVELANQSANGTYDNETDRYQLQKELNQLREEIDRIADSSNFNGINLLDGSMDAESDLSTKVNFNVGGVLPGVGQILGTDTVLHNENLDGTGTEFGVAFHDYTFDNKQGDSMTLTIGEGKNANTITLERLGATADAISGKDIVDAIKNGTNSDYKVTINGKEYNSGDTFKIGGQDFKFGTGVKNYTLQMVQIKAPTTEAEEVDASMKVTLSGVKSTATKAVYSFDLTDALAAATAITGGGKLDIAGATATIAQGATAGDIKTAIEGMTITGYTATFDESTNKVTLTATEAGAKDKPVASMVAASSTTLTGKFTTGSLVASGTSTVKLNLLSTTSGTTSAKFDIKALTSSSATGTTVVTSIAAGAFASKNGVGSSAVKGSFTAYAQIPDPSNSNALTGVAVKVDYEVKALYKDDGTWDGSAELILNYSMSGEDSYDLSRGVALTFKADAGAGNLGTNAQTSTGYTFYFDEPETVYSSITYSIAQWDESGTLTLGDQTLEYSEKDSIGDRTFTVDGNTYKASVSEDGNTLTLTATEAGVTKSSKFTTQAKGTITKSLGDLEADLVTEGSDGVEANVKGDYNVSDVDIKQVTAGGSHRLASTWFNLTDEMVEDGSELRIGDSTYVFTSGKALPTGATTGAIIVDISSGDLDTIAKNLTDAAAANDLYTVGHDGKRITLTETVEHDEDVVHNATDGEEIKWDLSTIEGIEKSLGFTGAKKTGNGLVLQIGDTADSFNQLRVNIRDAHCSALGIDSISIADQQSASDAVEVIKAAINQVSDIRGTLGATQNRLDHTINNLSVMTENIQDAESTIRDVDVAEEMMAYTKNNILIQSAQAMLAQANQVPQGVLQLLQ